MMTYSMTSVLEPGGKDERFCVLFMTYFTEIEGSAHKLNCLIPALRNIDYDLRPGFNR